MSTTKTATAKVAKQEAAPLDENIIASLVINGDLSKLAPPQKVEYYKRYCEHIGLDASSQPFQLLRLNGKEVLYCTRSGAQQLNRLHGVSHEIKAREVVNDCYVVTARAYTSEGRSTESIGAVSISGLKGESLCNAYMKSETKAKRRATLDLLGLGILDESETETIPNAMPIQAPATLQAAIDGNLSGVPQKTQSTFKTKYDEAEKVAEVLETAGSVRDIAELYYHNCELVEATPEVKEKFSEKKNSFYNKPSAKPSMDDVAQAG